MKSRKASTATVQNRSTSTSFCPPQKAKKLLNLQSHSSTRGALPRHQILVAIDPCIPTAILYNLTNRDWQ
jgi:hypothetical protein